MHGGARGPAVFVRYVGAVGGGRPRGVREKNPPVTASSCQPPLGKGAEGTGDADCHSQFANWPRNDRVFARGAVQVRAGGQGRPPLRKCILRCVGEGLCPSRGRGNRRSAAGGGCSEPVSRKCPDWRTRQWPGIGWHDGGQENPAPTDDSTIELRRGWRPRRPSDTSYQVLRRAACPHAAAMVL